MKYYISENGKPAGPFTIEELRMRSVVPSTPVGYDGRPDWGRADSIEAIRREVLASGSFQAEAPFAPQRPTRAPGEYPDNEPRFCPSTYLVPAILLTVCCCNPVAIVAIVYALKVQPAYSRGDYHQALDNSLTARRWCIIAAIAWVAIFIITNAITWPPVWPVPDIFPF